MSMKKNKYVLITPMHNEESLIGKVIESVINQSIQPAEWIIVNDRSTDNSKKIIEYYQKEFDFIKCVDIGDGEIQSYYSRKTKVFLHGYKLISSTDYDFIGQLDADITMDADYYENILKEFSKDNSLGVASGIYMDLINGQLREVHIAKTCTPGAIQLFRKNCYEKIGGYIPLKYGGEDSVADIMIRMHAWKSLSFSEYKVIHHRPTGTGSGSSIYKARYVQGKTDHALGSHPLFMVAKLTRRMFIEKPLIIGSMFRLMGYLISYVRREKRQIPAEVVKHLRVEQLKRLVNL